MSKPEIKMSNNDTSDEAMCYFASSKESDGDSYHMCSQAYGDGIEKGWQECRRRCEAQMGGRERTAFMAGRQKNYSCSLTEDEEAYRAFKERS